MENDISIKELGIELKKKWNYEEDNLPLRLGKFFKQLKIDSEESKILKKLLKNFIYFSEKEEKKVLRLFRNNIIKLNKDKTMYSSIEDASGKYNSSYQILAYYKQEFKVENTYSYEVECLKKFDVENLVLFDDISGTGSTIVNFFKRKLKLIQDKKVNIYLYIYFISEEAKIYIEKFCKENKIKIEIREYKLLKKCFKADYIYEKNCVQAKEEIIRKHEKNIWGGKGEKYILGYNNSQLLIAFYRNTPNNTLSSFWVENENWTGFFKREKKGLQMKKVDKKKFFVEREGIK